MFKELSPLLAKRSLILTATSVAEDRIRVTITPRPTGKDDPKELSQPFVVEGTAEELDNELPAAIVSYTAQHMSLERSLEQVKTEMDAALKEVKDEAAKKIAEAKKASKTTSTSKPAVKVEPAKPETPKVTPPSLFDAPEDPQPSTEVSAASDNSAEDESDEADEESDEEAGEQPEESAAVQPASASVTPINQPALADTRNEEDEILQEAFFGTQDNSIAA